MAIQITLTDNAVKKIESVAKEQGLDEYGLRMCVIGGGCSGMQYRLDLEDKPKGKDRVLESNGVKIFVDLKSLLFLAGVEIDYIEDLMQSGFKITNPNAKSTCGCGQSFH